MVFAVASVTAVLAVMVVFVSPSPSSSGAICIIVVIVIVVVGAILVPRRWARISAPRQWLVPRVSIAISIIWNHQGSETRRPVSGLRVSVSEDAL